MPARQNARQGREFTQSYWALTSLHCPASRVSLVRFPCRSPSLLKFSSSQLEMLLGMSGRAWHLFPGKGSQAQLGDAWSPRGPNAHAGSTAARRS